MKEIAMPQMTQSYSLYFIDKTTSTDNYSACILGQSQSNAWKRTSHYYRLLEYNLNYHCKNFTAIYKIPKIQAFWD